MSNESYICTYYVRDELGLVRADICYSKDHDCHTVKYYDEKDDLIWGESISETLDTGVDSAKKWVYA